MNKIVIEQKERAGAAHPAVPDVPPQMLGYELLAKALKDQDFETAFFVMGGPLTEFATLCQKSGLRMIDSRHEQGAAFMAQAYARASGGVALCMACSGPGTTNLASGIANAFVDGAPVIALGGSSPISGYGTQAFQEIDQVAVMRPVTKWSARVHDARRFPEYLAEAKRHALSGKPGPVYLDLPADVLFSRHDPEQAGKTIAREKHRYRSAPAAGAVEEVMTALASASRPIVVTGSGILWSGAGAELLRFIDATGIPYFPTPQGRGAVPDDHAACFPHARSAAFREADLVLVIGTRLNYVIGHGKPPRFSTDARIVQVDADPEELARENGASLGIESDALAFLQAANAAWPHGSDRYAAWSGHLQALETKLQEERPPPAPGEPIHPLVLCAEVGKILDRDAVLVVDGQEILNYGRQSLSTYALGRRLNSGPYGMMGVGVPFGVGAKAALPGAQVVVLTGDGSFGMNGFELDVSVRHNLPILVVISLNGGWTADADGKKAGSRLGYTRYEKIAETLGCHAEYVERAADIAPALERARRIVAEGRSAVVNVKTDPRARAQTTKFSNYRT